MAGIRVVLANLALLLSLFVACQASASRCPSAEDMSPCTCKSKCPDCPAEMSCSNINQVRELTAVFEKTRNYPFKDLVVENSVFPFLPSEGIEEKGFRSIHLIDNHMQRIFENAPSSKFVNEIRINNTVFQRGFQSSLFSNLTELRRIVIVKMGIKKITKQFGSDMPVSLTNVWLEDTKTSAIESGAFENLVNLETLYITKSYIRELDRSILPVPSKIKAFTILDSRVQTIPEDMFSEMPDLRYIVLAGNFISKFQRSVFENVLPQLSMLSLDGNSLRCDCSTRWVTEVRKFPHFFSAKCTEPMELQDKRLDILKRTDFGRC